MPRNRPATNKPYTPVDHAARARARTARKQAAAATAQAEQAAVIAKIALDHLGLVHLDTRNSDRLDWHEHSCTQVRAALEAAYAAGQRAAVGCTCLGTGHFPGCSKRGAQ